MNTLDGLNSADSRYEELWIDMTGNAKEAGLSSDLGLSSSDYSLAVSLFFIGESQPTLRTGESAGRLAPTIVGILTDRIRRAADPLQHDPYPRSPPLVPARYRVCLGMYGYRLCGRQQ